MTIDDNLENEQNLESLVIHSIYSAEGFDDPILDEEGNPAVLYFQKEENIEGEL